MCSTESTSRICTPRSEASKPESPTHSCAPSGAASTAWLNTCSVHTRKKIIVALFCSRSGRRNPPLFIPAGKCRQRCRDSEPPQRRPCPTARRSSAHAGHSVSTGLPGFFSALDFCILRPVRLQLGLPAMPCPGIVDWPGQKSCASKKKRIRTDHVDFTMHVFRPARPSHDMQ